MQVLFLQDVKSVARKGDIKQVKDGYYKNFLFPRKLAVLATGAAVKQSEKMRQSIVIQKERLVEEVQEVQKKLDGLTVVISRKSRGDKLYGSVAEKDVIAAVEKASKVRLEKSNLKIAEPIKTLGEHKVLINLADDVDASITVEVKSE